LFGIDNLIFLLFPVRMVATTPGDMQHIGRIMVEMMLKILILALGCGMAATAGAIVFWLADGSWAATLAVSWAGLLSCGCLTVPCLSWAYLKFDVSIDTPA
jgi:hypothetical protein